MNIYQKIAELTTKAIPLVVVSVVEKSGDGPVEVGKKMLVTFNEELYGTVGGGALEFNAIELCKDIFKTKTSMTETYLLNEGKVIKDVKTVPMTCGGVVKLYYEYIGPKEYIYIFGAGHVSQALTNVLKTMNYYVTVIDDRKAVVDKFVGGDDVVLSGFAEYIDKKGLVENSFAVVCTPSHKFDYKVVNKVIEKQIKLKYLGMLCSKEKLKDFIGKTYEKFGKDVDLTNFYSPVGIDLGGGGSPEEIAISITSEILLISNGKKGPKHMRESINNDKYHYWKNKQR